MKCNAILLAGGLSSRMGKDKAMLIRDGATLLQTAYTKISEVVQSCGSGRVLVSGNYPEFSGISDLQPERGPIEGLWACTRHLDYDSQVLVFPVDMPLLTQQHFQSLFKADLNAECVQFENWEMPFVFKFNQQTEEILKAVREAEESSKRSIKFFKSFLKTELIRAVDSRSFKNVNTPGEWKEVCCET